MLPLLPPDPLNIWMYPRLAPKGQPLYLCIFVSFGAVKIHFAREHDRPAMPESCLPPWEASHMGLTCVGYKYPSSLTSWAG